MEDTPIQPVVPIIDGLGPGKTRMLGYCGIDGNRLVKVEFKCIDILGNPIGPYTQYFGKHAVVIHEDNQNNSMVGSSD
jgi:hypothetical protein